MTKRPCILLTNDDGYDSIGIFSLYKALCADFDVVVSAPQTEQSGIGHAFTFNKPISYRPLTGDSGMCGWAVSGSPSDCVKIAVSHLMPAHPDIVVSGMNIGENSGISSFYSGTVAGAREGAFWRIPSFAFSVCAHGRNHLDAYSTMSASLLKQIMANQPADMTGTTFYNVNFPDCAPQECRGVKATRQSCAYFDDKYKPVTNTDGSEGFIVYGDKMDLEESDEFDSRAIINNYIAITPLCFDATANRAIPFLSKLSQQSE